MGRLNLEHLSNTLEPISTISSGPIFLYARFEQTCFLLIGYWFLADVTNLFNPLLSYVPIIIVLRMPQ